MTNFNIRHAALEVLGTNVHKVWVGSKTVLFSYGLPVALWIRGTEEEPGFSAYMLNDSPTPTTRKHMNQFGPVTGPGRPEVNLVTPQEMDFLLDD